MVVYASVGKIRCANDNDTDCPACGVLHPFREGNGRAQRAFFAQLARSSGFTLAWQHLDAARNIEASAAIMRGDPEPMRKMLDVLVRDGT